jgi:metal-dependent amidase/aminoacylase/carboxypeptidase family protein
MENLKQGVAPLILLRKELHKYPEVSGKEVGTAKELLLFWKNIQPMK